MDNGKIYKRKIYKRFEHPGQKQAGTIKNENDKNGHVTVLMNAMYYFLNWAIIHVEDDGFRLLVKRAGQISTDRIYSTLKGAKGAFFLAYRNLAFKDSFKPEWSYCYLPEEKWLSNRLQDC